MKKKVNIMYWIMAPIVIIILSVCLKTSNKILTVIDMPIKISEAKNNVFVS